MLRKASDVRISDPGKIYVPDEGMNVTGISLMRSERGKHGMICSEIGYIGSED
ncbi:MAG: hypothetical protein K6F86_12600 [Lachnospiraceae bacterium]|nr:hypothetical protein [Lachnospiraceae bacterium]